MKNKLMTAEEVIADLEARLAGSEQARQEADQRYLAECQEADRRELLMREALERVATERFPFPTPCRETYLRDIAATTLSTLPARSAATGKVLEAAKAFVTVKGGSCTGKQIRYCALEEAVKEWEASK